MKPSIITTAVVFFGLAAVGCGTASPPTQALEPTAAASVIIVDGHIVELVPGENVLPEIYEAIKSPEILEHNDWVLVDGYWDLMPKGVEMPLEVLETIPGAADEILFPGFPENWQGYSMPGLDLEFDYPSDWQVEILEYGLQMHSDARAMQISVGSYENAVGASLVVWLAEYGPDLPGEVVAEYEETIRGQPFLRQHVLLPAAGGEPATESIRLWIGAGDRVTLWTASPGGQPEVLDIVR